MLPDYDIFVRSQEDCVKIDTGNGETVYEMIGLGNGNTKKHSIAFVEILPEGGSVAHFHPEAEENYLVMEGIGTLILDGKEQTIVSGDVVVIPVGKVHQIFNKDKETLKFFCICAPAWTYEGFITDLSKAPSSTQVAKQLTIVKTEIAEKESTAPSMIAHEESYIIHNGHGLIVIEGKEQEVTSGDVATIPPGKNRQIINAGSETLTFHKVTSFK